MNRRAFLALAAAASFDPERLLWHPGARLISIPKPLPPMTIHDLIATPGRHVVFDDPADIRRFATFLDSLFVKSVVFKAVDGGRSVIRERVGGFRAQLRAVGRIVGAWHQPGCPATWDGYFGYAAGRDWRYER